MQDIIRASDRGVAEFGWLHSRHTFSFGEYYNPARMGFGPLRVINDDVVDPGRGFGTHGHADMEIVSVVLEGALQHKDSMGTGSVLRPGHVQRMSAGTGVRHSEFNGSQTEPVHFLQIWLMPEERGIKPSYEEKHFDVDGKHNRLRAIVAKGAREGAVDIHQDITLMDAHLDAGAAVEHAIAPARRAYVHVVSGDARVNGEALHTGDAMALESVERVRIEGIENAEILVFDLP
jgi:hypothetical protein